MVTLETHHIQLLMPRLPILGGRKMRKERGRKGYKGRILDDG